MGVPAGGRSGGARSRCRREAATRGGSACDAAHGLPHAAGRGNAAWASLREGAPAGPEAELAGEAADSEPRENSQSNEGVMNDGASGTARGASVRVCCRRCALNGASGGADALKPTCGAAVSNGGASGTARGASVRVCSRRYALNGASGGAGALKPTCGAAVLNGGASGTARGATVRVCPRRCALNGASGGAAQVRDQRRCGWHLVGQQRHLGCDGGAPLLGFSVSLWSLALKPLHRGDGGMQGIGAPFAPNI